MLMKLISRRWSFHFILLGGIQQPKMMKFRGSVYGQDMVILVNGVASHNFMSSNLTHWLKLTTTPTPSFKVKLGDGCRVPFEEICKGLELDLHDFNVKANSYVFPLEGVDMISGVA